MPSSTDTQQKSTWKFQKQPLKHTFNLEIWGNLRSAEFHKSRLLAEEIYKNYPFIFLKIKAFLPFEWQNMNTNENVMIEIKPDMTKNKHAVEYKNKYSGYTISEFQFRQKIPGQPLFKNKDGEKDWSSLDKEYLLEGWSGLKNYAIDTFGLSNETDLENEYFDKIAENEFQSYMNLSKNDFVKMNVSVNNEPAGALTFELFQQKCPKTCQNFVGLVNAYQNTIFHRIVPNGWIQGGDTSNHFGKGGQAMNGPVFEDENFSVPHSQRGILSMTNNGPHTNQSQFFITLKPMECFDTLYVAFGRVIDGEEVLKKMESVEVDWQGRPMQQIKIETCQLLKTD